MIKIPSLRDALEFLSGKNQVRFQNITVATAEIVRLEKELGREHGPALTNIKVANAQVLRLEAALAEKQGLTLPDPSSRFDGLSDQQILETVLAELAEMDVKILNLQLYRACEDMHIKGMENATAQQMIAAMAASVKGTLAKLNVRI